MNYPRVATRYSKALLDLAVEQNDLDRISSDVAVLKEAIKGSEELKSLLKSPVVKAGKNKPFSTKSSAVLFRHCLIDLSRC